MPTIALRFLAGRYHATPWGRHVNEGDVEWPPSPWRVIRALLATGFVKHGWREVPDEARGLVFALAEEPPSYRLPSGELAHTRHYMPIIEGKKQTTTKVIDSFIRLDPNEDLLIHFQVILSTEHLRLLDDLITSLSYFGRAESWADGRLIDDVVPDSSWCVARRDSSASLSDRGGDHVVLLSPVPAAEYDSWRRTALERAKHIKFDQVRVAASDRGRKVTKKQLSKDEARINAIYPEDLIACLLTDTADLQQQGWSQPPGSRQILYTRPPGILDRKFSGPAFHRRAKRPAKAALLALASDTARGDLLPLLTRCLPQAELLHQSLVALLGHEAPRCPVLSGRDQATRQCLKGHQHVHYLPLDLDEDG